MTKEEIPSLKETFKKGWKGLLLPLIILVPFILDYFFKSTFFTERLGKTGASAMSSALLKYSHPFVLDEAAALFAGGKLTEADRDAFIDEMEEIFWDSKEEAKKYTPKKYRREN